MANARGYRSFRAVVFAVCALLVPSLSYADSNVRIVRLSDVEGDVQIDRTTGRGFEKAVQNMPITQGIRLQTGMTGRAEVEFENGSVLRLVGDTSVEFSNLSLRSNGDQVNEIRLNEGTAYANFRHKGKSDFRILAGNLPINLEKDVRLRLKVDREQAEIAVFKGEVKIQQGDETVKVKKKQTLALNLSDPASYNLAKEVSRYPSDDYNGERDQYLDEYVSTKDLGNSPYAYGYSDMNRYGSFFYAPGYGTLWRPAGFGSGWDPFSDGYWAFYPGYGYVWVSGYQWGWTPYRFGAWTFVPAYGWCWQPGGWNRWNTGINVVNPPTGWRNPAPPPPGSGGTTVVVGHPRGPRNPRMPGSDEAGAMPRNPRTGPVRGLPGQAPRPAVQPKPTVPGAGQPNQPAASQPGKMEPTRPTKVLPDPDVRGNSGARGTRPEPPSRSAPPASAPRQATPPPTPRMQATPPPAPPHSPAMQSGGARQSKTSPK